jgi:broad specificity phosphatase PhoE
MGRLLLVRHAQASFFSQDYDQLSVLGEEQARHLGEYWALHKTTFDRIVTGPSLRHQRTAQIAGEACRKAGLSFAEPIVLAELGEFPGEAILGGSLPQLLPRDKQIRDLHEALQRAVDENEKRAAFQRLFEVILLLWVHEEIALPNVETWQEFCARVNRGLTSFLNGSRKGANVLIFTSAGPIAVAMQRALHLSAQDTVKLSWMSRNCSYSEFLFSGDRFTLSSFNSFPHLKKDFLLTYR